MASRSLAFAARPVKAEASGTVSASSDREFCRECTMARRSRGVTRLRAVRFRPLFSRHSDSWPVGCDFGTHPGAAAKNMIVIGSSAGKKTGHSACNARTRRFPRAQGHASAVVVFRIRPRAGQGRNFSPPSRARGFSSNPPPSGSHGCLRAPKGGTDGWSEENTEAFAGLHNKDRRVVLLFDESSAIAKDLGSFRGCADRWGHRNRLADLWQPDATRGDFGT